MMAIIVPYGVDHEMTPVDRPSNPALRIEDGNKVALFLGRVHPKKNVEFLIEAWAAAKRDSCWKLVIAGPAERWYERSLRARVEAVRRSRFGGFHRRGGRGGQGLFAPARPNWFLLPSLQENFGIAPLEAMHNGCPVANSTEVYIGDYFTSWRLSCRCRRRPGLHSWKGQCWTSRCESE